MTTSTAPGLRVSKARQGTLRRILWVLIAISIFGSLLLRWRAPHLLMLARPAYAWVGLFTLSLFTLRCLWMFFDALKERLPWTRLLIPLVVLLEGLGLAWKGDASRFWQELRLGTAIALEFALILFAVRVWRKRKHDADLLPEDDLAQPISAFLPPAAARLMALELTMLGGAVRFMFGGYQRPDPPGFSYHHRCVLKGLLPALPVLIIADLVALEFLLRGWPLLRWFVHLGDAYAILWFTGLWASFRARPHQVSEHAVVLHHGILGRLELRKDQIVDITPPPAFKDDWARLSDNRKVIQLQAPGPPLLDIQLSEPLSPIGFLGLRKPKSRVRIAVDDPEAFRAALGLV